MPAASNTPEARTASKRHGRPLLTSEVNKVTSFTNIAMHRAKRGYMPSGKDDDLREANANQAKAGDFSQTDCNLGCFNSE